jgi:tetratricopeptide (TPR) repeat protein
VLEARGQIQRVVQEVDAIAAKPNASAQDLNNAAWVKLVEGSDLANAALQVRRALQLAPDEHNILNTAAAIAAERSDFAEAREHLDKANDGEDPPPADWYVHGRIFEQLGLRDDAIAAYRKAAAKPSESITSTYHVATRRLKALGVTK